MEVTWQNIMVLTKKVAQLQSTLQDVRTQISKFNKRETSKNIRLDDIENNF